MIKEIEVGGVKHSITLADDLVGQGLAKDENGVVSVEKLVKVTWAELKTLRDEAKLNAGTYYRIIDYVTTTTQSDTKSANHPFDVIVLALSENTLCEDAKAILHEGDEYFAHCDLSAWELKYCLDNDKTRFDWADETNGKGVIYRMLDEKRNDCPYDFKNILIYNIKYTDSFVTSDKYYYTFSYVVNNVLYDGTTEARVKKCYGNSMNDYRSSGKLLINKNVFKNTLFGSYCSYNTLENDCSYNTLENDCSYNTLENDCSYNTLENDCSYNTLENDCTYNRLGNSTKNRKLEGGSNKAAIYLSEEFYDDGSGQVVPIKHPDLSTQPSILPYKFMGQYVYEVLLPIPDIDLSQSQYLVNASHLLEYVKDLYSVTILQAEELLFCHRETSGFPNIPMFVHRNVSISTSEQYGGTAYYDLIVVPDTTSMNSSGTGEVVGAYLRIVYTSMPEAEESSYYGYNYRDEDFSNAAVIRLAGDYMSVQNVNFLMEDLERINANTYVYKNVSAAPGTTYASISIEDNTGNLKKPKSVKIYLDGVELDSTKVNIQDYGVIDFSTPLEINDYNTIKAIINL